MGLIQKFDGAHIRAERRCGVDNDCTCGEILVWIRNGEESRVFIDELPRIYSVGLE